MTGGGSTSEGRGAIGPAVFLRVDRLLIGYEELPEWMKEASESGLMELEEVTVLSCDGPEIPVLRCPKCFRSRLIPKGAWIHVSCGNLTFEPTRCPRCGKVEGEELVDVGPYYTCGDCGWEFPYPILDHGCDNPSPMRAWKVTLSDEGRRVFANLRRELDLEAGIRILNEDLGEFPADVLVISGGEIKALIIDLGLNSLSWRVMRIEEMDRELGIRVGFLRGRD